mmetsp:Transcript_66059/g.177655  ORF Transcript_66059/g.177655 Transcript_66059/m.177655 type:complete len:271 (+) Transcript_66059:167-979(+)
MTFCAGSGMCGGIAGILRFTSISRVRSARVLMPWYGSVPPKISVNMQPIDQMSTFSVIFDLLSKSSGAMYLGEPPLFFFVMWVRSIGSVRPKSQILTFKLRSRTTLSDFRSRCTIVGVCEWRYITPSAICKHMFNACNNGNSNLLTCSKWCKEPPGQYSVTRQGCGNSRQAPMKRTRRLCLRWRKDSISLDKSCMTSSDIVSSQYIFLIATSFPWYEPRKTCPNSPDPKLSTNSKSSKIIFSGADKPHSSVSRGVERRCGATTWKPRPWI